MRSYHELLSGIIDPEPLFRAWHAFRRGKGSRPDVQRFERDLEARIFRLHRELRDGSYRHGRYAAFTVCDPKHRRIHKAGVRDRIVHHAVHAAIEPLFEPAFYAHSYSCRKGKGTHRAMRTLHAWLHQVSGNGHRSCFVLQCDIRRFFASVSHQALLDLLSRRISDTATMRLLSVIIGSYRSVENVACGLPLGNLTSQLFANVYLGELDWFVKHEMRIRRYIRYTDDFAIVGTGRDVLDSLVEPIQTFLNDHLRLDLHPHKVTIRKFRQGIDFLGYVLLPHHRVVRTATWRRLQRRLDVQSGDDRFRQSLQSAFGVLSHADSYERRMALQQRYVVRPRACA